MNILVADQFPESALNDLRQLGLKVSYVPDGAGPSLESALRTEQPDVLVVRGTKVDATHLLASSSLALVIRAGAGVNTIDVKKASSEGIYVANCPGKNAIAVAELAFAHLLSIDRHIVNGASDLRQGIWNKKTYSKARGIFGRRLGVLGVGDIGKEMISRAQAFGLKVIVWSRSLTKESAHELGVEYAASPLEVAKHCDILSVHLALTPETRGLVSAEVLNALPKDAVFINTSRGEVVDHAALEDAMTNRGLYVGLDVFEGEPSGGTGTLQPGIFAQPRAQGSHHIGASTEQSQDAVASEAVRIVTVYLKEGRVENSVNLAQKADATHLLVVRHRDEVGVLAGVLDALREGQINVQGMDNILFAGGEAACARIQIEGEPTAALLNQMRAAPAILALSVTRLA
jgi:D-3-phosphoglycerate dehydrogenase